MMTFDFEVDFAVDHAAMAAGITRTTFVAVQADDADAAMLLATQMASRHGIATAARHVA